MSVQLSTGFAAAILGPQSFAQIFQDGVIEIRSGPQPATADAAPTGTLLARITRDGGAWVAGSPTNGLRFSLGGRYAMKELGHVWRINGSGTGVAGWFRLLPNVADSGLLSATDVRIDGAIGLSETPGDFQMFIPDLSIVPATDRLVTDWRLGIPPL